MYIARIFLIIVHGYNKQGDSYSGREGPRIRSISEMAISCRSCFLFIIIKISQYGFSYDLIQHIKMLDAVPAGKN